jgi:hypothetical protein
LLIEAVVAAVGAVAVGIVTVVVDDDVVVVVVVTAG